MATSWKVRGKRFDTGPEWDTTADWEDMDSYWEWTKTWIISGKGILGEET